MIFKKGENENENERIGEFNEWMIDFDVGMIIEMK